MKNIYLFSEGYGKDKMLLGGKGANLVEMHRIGLPIPMGVVISTEACRNYLKERKLTEELRDELKNEIKKLEEKTGKRFEGENPLLVSVRSGAPISMPGMMDTILNLGLNDKTLEMLIRKSGKEKFCYEIYIRFIEMFSEIVMGIPKEEFYEIKEKLGKDFKKIITEYKKFVLEKTGKEFPEKVEDQLFLAVEAIFKSWNNERAKIYREIHEIDHNMGTAVVIQEMVFGNFDENSGTGVAFTRNPSNGEKVVFGEYLLEAQGEDIVAGIRTPLPLDRLKEQLPKVHQEFLEIAEKLEKHYKDMQDIEFTIEGGKLYILQTRNGKRSPYAGIKIAMDMLKEGVLTEKEAILKVDIKSLPQILSGNFNEKELSGKKLLGKGLPGSAGVAVGKVVLSSERVKEGESSILVRMETSPEDIKGMSLAKGIVTVKGGATSHGAVVARGMGKCCVTGCEEIVIDKSETFFTIDGVVVKEGDYISVSGYTGEIYLGKIPLDKTVLPKEFEELMELCRKYKKLGIRMNADTEVDIEIGKKFGAEGVGLCRTEHMFFQGDRIWKVREMIVSSTSEERKEALKDLLELQRGDFIDILEKMDGLPVNIRLLDPPLHEFLPKKDKDIEKLATLLGKSKKDIEDRMRAIKEENPMLGHRGCRLAVTYPEIYEMQVRAIVEAALKCKEDGKKLKLEIMIPLTQSVEEFKYVKEIIENKIEKVLNGKKLDYEVGTMIELPRACLLADEIAKESKFFSFGTNDLTQTTLGMSRDDSTKFIGDYKEKKLLEVDPFQSIDVKGVGKLVKMAVELGRKSNPTLHVGVCGEHGGDPKSIEFFNKVGLDYVSCSPYRVPIAIVAAAKSEIEANR